MDSCKRTKITKRKYKLKKREERVKINKNKTSIYYLAYT